MHDIGLQDPQGVAIVEAALLLEAGVANHFDRLIVVTCGDEQRVARFAARQKIDLEAARKEVMRRMAAQLPDEEKIKAADYVIDNSGSLDQTRERDPSSVGEAAGRSRKIQKLVRICHPEQSEGPVQFAGGASLPARLHRSFASLRMTGLHVR